MSWVWGLVLVMEFFLCWLLACLTPARFLALSPVVGYAVMASLMLWTILYRRHRRRLALPDDAPIGLLPGAAIK